MTPPEVEEEVEGEVAVSVEGSWRSGPGGMAGNACESIESDRQGQQGDTERQGKVQRARLGRGRKELTNDINRIPFFPQPLPPLLDPLQQRALNPIPRLSKLPLQLLLLQLVLSLARLHTVVCVHLGLGEEGVSFER